MGSIAELAAEAALSVPAFCRFFKRLTQRTLTEFVNERRVERACQLLRVVPTITKAASTIWRISTGSSASSWAKAPRLIGVGWPPPRARVFRLSFNPAA